MRRDEGVWQPTGKTLRDKHLREEARFSQIEREAGDRWSEERDEEEWQTVKESQDGCLERKISSPHKAPICCGTNHCSARQAQRGKHFSSPHRQALESCSIFPDGLSSNTLSWSCFR
ncbi:hypothetical protein PAMP_004123 [Pampus punctatissimus]